MTLSTFNQIVLATAVALSGCTSSTPVSNKAQNDMIIASSANEQLMTSTSVSFVNDANGIVLNDSNDTALNDANDTETLLYYYIAPHKVECESFQLTQCMLIKQTDQTDTQLFYDSIDGFDYQWGYEYELLVSVTTEKPAFPDASRQRYELVEIITQSEYQHEQSFEYVARYANESIVKVSSGEYRLLGNQSMVCGPASCASIDSALEQGQSILLDVQYAVQPGGSLQLVAVICAESRSAFNSACMGG